MAFTFEQWHGTQETIDRESSRKVLKYRGIGDLPSSLPGGFSDFSNYVGSIAMAFFNGETIQSASGDTLYVNSIQISEERYAQVYMASVEFGPINRQTGSYTLTYNGTGGTVHATAGTRVAGYGPAGEIKNNGGLIKVVNGEAKGINIPSPQTRLTVSYRHPGAFLNAAYLKSITELTGHYNSTTFLTYDPGEVRFSGPDATETESEATAQYSFEISRNRENFDVGGITIVSKKGWEILSETEKPDVDADGNAVQVLQCIEVIKDVGGLDGKDFASIFGWGG